MKTIGLDGSRAFLRYRTGIEEYSYQVIKHLREEISPSSTVFLYVRKKLRIRQWKPTFVYPEIDFELPHNWKCVGIWAPRYWTQVGLSIQMFFSPVDTLFVPAHTLPLLGGRRNVVTVHGLEYEMSPESYGFWERMYMRYSIRYSCLEADTVIAVSQNTKHDLVKLYGTPEEKTVVIGEGFIKQEQSTVNNRETPHILFIGRIEERKNIVRIIEAFEILKEKYGRNEKLILVGKPGCGYEKIQTKIRNSKWQKDIIERGYISSEEKFQLLSEAEVFVFPSLYEGFGLPVLEAQAAGIPVVTSNTSSLPEVGGEGAFYVDPLSVESIAEDIMKVFQMNEEKKIELQEKMQENLKRFSWNHCASQICKLL